MVKRCGGACREMLPVSDSFNDDPAALSAAIEYLSSHKVAA